MNWLRKVATPLVIGVVTVVFVISLGAVIYWWREPAKVQAIGGFFAVVSTLILVIITWAYVRANQESIEGNRRQQEQMYPNVKIEVRRWVARFNKKRKLLMVYTIVRMSNPSPFAKITLWVADAKIAGTELKLSDWFISHADNPSGSSSSEKTITLGPAESKEQELCLGFICEEFEPESVMVTLFIDDVYGKRAAMEAKAPLIRDDYR
jgi:membrane-bound metal-dependent hydrolase YbcI (DUF457 family)